LLYVKKRDRAIRPRADVALQRSDGAIDV